MPAAVAIPSIVGAASAGASAYGAHRAASASREAADIQARSADRAQAFNERVYGQQQQALNPYMQMGQDSLARLFSQHWGTPYQPQQPQAPPTNSNMAMPRGSLGFGGGQPMPPRSLGGMPIGGPQMQARMNPDSLGGMQSGGQMVRLQAPTGEVQEVPAHVADGLIARGATRLN